MAKVIFYEKTGCVNNTKQKRILELAGHQVEAVDIIDHPWTASELKDFFSNVAFEQWFNMNAPTISSGQDSPANYNEETAIEAMLADHLLIKRPLMIIENNKMVGFNKEKLEELIGIEQKQDAEMADLLKQNLEHCPQKAKNTNCD